MTSVFVLDVGSHSLTALALAPGVVWERTWTTRLAEGDGFGPQSVERLARALSEAMESCPVRTRPVAVCTGIFRKKDPPPEVVHLLGSHADWRIIDGEREAILSAEGLAFRLSVEPPFTVIDPGGATTEVAVVNSLDPEGKKHDIGVDSLAVGVLTAGSADEALMAGVQAVVQLSHAIKGPLWGVGGTITTLAALRLGLSTYSAEAVNGVVLTLDDLSFLREMAVTVPADELASIPVVGDRAPSLAAGASLVLGLVKGFGARELRVADAGIRWGLAAELLGWRRP